MKKYYRIELTKYVHDKPVEDSSYTIAAANETEAVNRARQIKGQLNNNKQQKDYYAITLRQED